MAALPDINVLRLSYGARAITRRWPGLMPSARTGILFSPPQPARLMRLLNNPCHGADIKADSRRKTWTRSHARLLRGRGGRLSSISALSASVCPPAQRCRTLILPLRCRRGRRVGDFRHWLRSLQGYAPHFAPWRTGRSTQSRQEVGSERRNATLRILRLNAPASFHLRPFGRICGDVGVLAMVRHEPLSADFAALVHHGALRLRWFRYKTSGRMNLGERAAACRLSAKRWFRDCCRQPKRALVGLRMLVVTDESGRLYHFPFTGIGH
jgi:hypothetical protein